MAAGKKLKYAHDVTIRLISDDDLHVYAEAMLAEQYTPTTYPDVEARIVNSKSFILEEGED